MATDSVMSGRPRTRHVWLVNHHALVPSKDGGSGRHLNMARYLPEHGWTASLIVASTIHSRGAQGMSGLRLRKITSEEGVPVLWIRATAYGRSMARRLVGMLVFAFVALLPGATRGLRQPDAVMGSTVHLLAAWVGWRLARRHRVPFIYEIRDVWPETLIDLGKLSPSSKLAKLMSRLSVSLCRRADLIVSPLPKVDLYLTDHGIDPAKFLWVSNGFDGMRDDAVPDDAPGATFTFMYLGAHGNANALDEILDAFESLHIEEPDAPIRLRLVGSGPLRQELIEYSRTLASAGKITFEERIPQTEVLERAREADCLVAALRDLTVYKYGISLNKLYTYLAAGRPIVLASSAPSDPVSTSAAGVVVPAGDRIALTEAMRQVLRATSEQRRSMAARGYNYVFDNFRHDLLARRLGAGLDAVVEARWEDNVCARPRVVHVSSAHPYTDNRIHYRECASLSDAGYDVSLVAVRTDVPGPESKVRVLTLPKRGRITRLIGSSAQAVWMALRTRARIVHLHDPELIPYIPILRLLRRKVLYDAHEDLPAQVMSKSYLAPWSASILRQVSRLLLQVTRAADLTVAATETIEEHAPSRRTTVVHNYPPLREAEAAAAEVDINTRPARVIYVGGISSKRGAETMIDALGRDAMPDQWTMSLAGRAGSTLLGVLREKPGWSKVDFVGQVGPEEARDLILGSRVGLLLFADNAAHRDALPTKMFEYLAAGVPVIASDFPLWRTIVEEHDCGVLVHPERPSEVAAAVRRYDEDPDLLARHSRNARRLAVETLNWAQEGQRLVQAYDRLWQE